MSASPTTTAGAPSRWELASDRFSPMLVKEVRQALRGRYFTALFWLTLCLATTLGAGFLVFGVGGRPGVTSGPQFFMLMYGCLSAAVHLFVPFSAYLSLGSERDENAYDLLVLSNLRPRQILLGKLLGCGVQVLLYYSAFLPFFAFAFLLPGVDLVAAGWVLGLTLASSLFVTVLAMNFASLVRQRLARSFVMAILAVVLVPATIMPIVAAQCLIFLPFTVGQPAFWIAVSAFLTAIGVLSAQLFAYGCTRLAHPEENRSSGLRVVTSAVVLAGLGWLLYAFSVAPQPLVLGGVSAVLIGAASVFTTAYVSEPEALGRRVRLHVPARRPLAWLALPYLPGGGRGFLFFLLHLGLLGAVFFAVLATRTGFGLLEWVGQGFSTAHVLPMGTVGALTSSDEGQAAVWVLTALVYCTVYVGLPSVLFSRLTAGGVWRVASRVGVPLLAFGAFFLPTLLGYLLGIRWLERAQHLGNPAWIFLRAADDEPVGEQLWTMLLAALLVVLLNVPRMLRGMREVLAAGVRRRELEKKRAAEAEPAVAGGGHALPDA